jgi:Ca-activated chloride channel family protein
MEQKPVWIWAAAAVLVVLVALRFAAPSVEPPAGFAAPQIGTSGAIRISLASGGNKEEWIHKAVHAFNAASPRDASLQLNGKPIAVEILQETVDGRKGDYRSGTMITDTLSGKIKPTVISPGEESWTLRFQKEWQAIHGRSPAREVGPVLLRSPLVIGTWQSRARALGCWPTPEPSCTWERVYALATSPDGWGVVGRPEWGRFKFGYGYVGESNSGTLGAIIMCMRGAGKAEGLTIGDVGTETGCGEYLAGIERAKVHSGVRSDWLFEQMSAGGPEYLDAIVTYELDVIVANRAEEQKLREPLVAMYPQDGTILVGHPFTILDGVPWVTAEQADAARVLQRFLLTSDIQRMVLPTGMRPADATIPLSAPIDPANGVNPEARLVPLEVPDGIVIDQITEVWHRVKKHAVVALVFDKSGSMAGGKITAAVKGAQEFVARMDRDDVIVWMPFDNRVYPAVEGRGADVGEGLRQQIGGTSAGGGTALYDAVLRAHEHVDGLRQADPTGRRYGIVILSDGKDESSRNSLATLEARLRPGEADPTGIQIHTIAIGGDADENVLRKIANAGHGRYWKGQSADDMARVYRGIATYY